jgi:diguanylate cyclase (GGDEF)-like protein
MSRGMRADSVSEESSRLLTPGAFAFVLDGELKRAVRSQNYLTLVVLETRREENGLDASADDDAVEEVAEVIGRGVRDTDVIGRTGTGSFALVLLDANLNNSAHVIDRLVSRIDDYAFPSPLRISVGAACYPTDAVDARSLTQQAVSRPIATRRAGPTAPRSSDSPH